jgi:hypothetical protein
MDRLMTRRAMLGAGLVAMPGMMTAALGQEPRPAAPGQPVVITVATAGGAPDVSLSLGRREAKVSPSRAGCTHTGGGNIDVVQPSPDVIVVTMSGVAVAYGSPISPASAALDFALTQAFEVSFDNPKVKAAKLCIEGRVIGFLRCPKTGTAESSGSAVVTGPGGPLLTAEVLSHAVGGCQSLGVNDKLAPSCVVVRGGNFCLSQTFHVGATMPKVFFPCKAPSAEFAPDPALDPLWISAKEPFHGAAKKDLGFQVVIRVTPETK